MGGARDWQDGGGARDWTQQALGYTCRGLSHPFTGLVIFARYLSTIFRISMAMKMT